MSNFAQPRFQDLPQDLIGPVLGLVDLCLPVCKIRRKFLQDWKDRGLEVAYSTWKQNEMMNPRFLSELEKKIDAVRAYRRGA